MSVEELAGAELVPDVPEVDWLDEEPVLALVVPLEPDDWLVLEPCDIDEDELTELLTPTLASTPTLGLTLSVFPPAEVELLGVVDELLLGDVEEELEAPGVLEDWPDLSVVELDELLLEGAVAEPFRFTSVELDELLLEGAVAEPFRFTSVELDELLGADAVPFTLMSVELDELPGVAALPFRLIEDDELGTLLVPLMVVDEEVDPGTTAMPGVTSVVVVLLLLDWVSGTLGMQPAGCVFAVSMHFGSRRSLVTLVIVSARATPKAASSEAARRLILKAFRFMSFPPFWTRSTCGTAPPAQLRAMVRAGARRMVQPQRPMRHADHVWAETYKCSVRASTTAQTIAVGFLCRRRRERPLPGFSSATQEP